jgi:hypothetical protein
LTKSKSELVKLLDAGRLYRKITRTSKVLFEIVKHKNIYTDLTRWRQDRFQMPSPPLIKRQVLLRTVIINSTIVETGTHTGDTSAILLKVAKNIISIEPDKELFRKASKRFLGNQKIQILNGTSESIFPDLIPSLSGDVSFWLDGHYSGEGTFMGEKETPIFLELQHIQENLSKFQKICVLIDDIRLFSPGISMNLDYPSLNYLVEWANNNHLFWYIEHDIFIAKNF